MPNPEKITEDVAKLTLDIELVKRDVLQFNKILEKLDTTNDKVQELITNISKIVSLHEQKFSVIEKEQANTSDEMTDFDLRLKSLEKFKWKISGALTIVSTVIGYIISILYG